jgi:uncharacterized membrane protein
MKTLCAGLVLVASAAFLGCETKSTSGGPGAKDSNRTGGLTQPENTFSLKPPMLSTTIKQGETHAVTISIDRGKNFDKDVALKFDDLPKGVTIEPASPTIKHGDKEAKVDVKAADDAALGDHVIKVVGHPSEGPDATHEMKIKVDKK